jgi:general secretion pathway protein G
MTALYTASRRSAARKGFTLVEILIVVIILGILAAIVIPQFTNASTAARISNMASQDQTVKSQIQLYKLQHNDTVPALVSGGIGGAAWDSLTLPSDVTGNTASPVGTTFGPYLQTVPINPLTGVSTVVPIGTTAATTTGWYYDATTGEFHGANATGAQSDDGN